MTKPAMSTSLPVPTLARAEMAVRWLGALAASASNTSARATPVSPLWPRTTAVCTPESESSRASSCDEPLVIAWAPTAVKALISVAEPPQNELE